MQGRSRLLLVATMIAAWCFAVVACTSSPGPAGGGHRTNNNSTRIGAPTPNGSSRRGPAPTVTPTTQRRTYPEIADNENGIPVFSTPDGKVASVKGIPFRRVVQVLCWTSNISGAASVNAWYYVVGPKPWRRVFASANTFANGDPVGITTNVHQIDSKVPKCRQGQLPNFGY